MEQSKCVKPWRNRVMDGRLKKTIKGIKKTTGILKKITRFVFAPVIFYGISQELQLWLLSGLLWVCLRQLGAF